MRYVWSRFLVIFLGAEAIVFMVYYYFGPSGIQTLHKLHKIKMTAVSDIARIKQENNQLREQIEAWKHDQFLQEKFAREKLAMQKDGETVYFR